MYIKLKQTSHHIDELHPSTPDGVARRPRGLPRTPVLFEIGLKAPRPGGPRRPPSLALSTVYLRRHVAACGGNTRGCGGPRPDPVRWADPMYPRQTPARGVPPSAVPPDPTVPSLYPLATNFAVGSELDRAGDLTTRRRQGGHNGHTRWGMR
eukprot:2070889-Pleurochrysis_carterae.AAC.1